MFGCCSSGLSFHTPVVTVEKHLLALVKAWQNARTRLKRLFKRSMTPSEVRRSFKPGIIPSYPFDLYVSAPSLTNIGGPI
jgi:hypothetical protein